MDKVKAAGQIRYFRLSYDGRDNVPKAEVSWELEEGLSLWDAMGSTWLGHQLSSPKSCLTELWWWYCWIFSKASIHHINSTHSSALQQGHGFWSRCNEIPHSMPGRSCYLPWVSRNLQGWGDQILFPNLYGHKHNIIFKTLPPWNITSTPMASINAGFSMCGTGHFLWHMSLIDDLISFHFMITKIKSCIIKLRLLGHFRLTELSVTYQGPHETAE